MLTICQFARITTTSLIPLAIRGSSGLRGTTGFRGLNLGVSYRGVHKIRYIGPKYTTEITTNGAFDPEGDKGRILESDIKMFLAERDVVARGLRTLPQPQLQCVGGTAMKHDKYHPRQIMCKNIGIDANGNVNWGCIVTPKLNKKVELGIVRVNFEGWSKPGDKYVRIDSGIVSYELNKSGYWTRNGEPLNDKQAEFVFVIIVIIIFALIVSYINHKVNHKPETRVEYVPVNISAARQGPRVPQGPQSWQDPSPVHVEHVYVHSSPSVHSIPPTINNYYDVEAEYVSKSEPVSYHYPYYEDRSNSPPKKESRRVDKPPKQEKMNSYSNFPSHNSYESTPSSSTVENSQPTIVFAKSTPSR